MSKSLKQTLSVIKLLPMIIAAVRAIEEAWPEKGNGKHKLELVLALIEQAFEAMQDAVSQWADIRPQVEGFIAKLVALWNSIGIFTKA